MSLMEPKFIIGISNFRSHCACDKIFYNCLKSVTINHPESKKVAKRVGSLFFNILRLDCMEPVYPKICVDSKIYYKVSQLLGWIITPYTNPDTPNSNAEEGCTSWEEDHDADPIDIKFLKSSKPF